MSNLLPQPGDQPKVDRLPNGDTVIHFPGKRFPIIVKKP